MKAKFIANTSTKKIHSIEYARKGCKLPLIKEVNKREFCTLEEALAFPGTNDKVFVECSFCMPEYRRANNKK